MRMNPLHPEWVWYNYFIARCLITCASCYGYFDVNSVISLSLCSVLVVANEGTVLSEGLLTSEALLTPDRPKHSIDPHCRFQFGLGEWTASSDDEKENEPAWAPRKKLKLTLNKLIE